MSIEFLYGDCLQLLPQIPDESIDAVITDPPYGMLRFDTDQKNFLDVVGPALRLCWQKMKPNASMFVFMSTAEVVNVANALGQPLKRLFWMYKPADCTYPFHGWLLTSEAILWFVKGDKPNLVERKPFRHDCYVHKTVGQEGVTGHPCVKPLWVVRDLVLRIPEGGVILDPFAGSATTGVACAQEGRSFIGMECDEVFFPIGQRRLFGANEQPMLALEGI